MFLLIGQLVSTKKDELTFILDNFNIQVRAEEALYSTVLLKLCYEEIKSQLIIEFVQNLKS